MTGQMIGRWGNYVNQEAYGGPVAETFLRDKLHLPNFIVDQMNVQGVYHHPTFLYESLWSLVGIIILFILRRQRFLRAAELFLSYFIWYSIGRFFIEGLRTDSLAFIGPNWLASFVDGLWKPMEWFGFEHGALDPAYGNVRISQLLAILIVVVAIVLIIVRRATGRAEVRYLDPIYSTKANHDQVPEAQDEENHAAKREAAPEESVTKHSAADNTEDKKE
ncbi:Prolipoprotein diacylglyceryl transferase [Paenibacillus sp. P1XP2]|nr:Prolipoprotein diacylglyceryl transferase [Paenibacillus sp. P1XP2]